MQSYPDISQLESLLFNVDAAFGAIESHGVLCGMLCAQGATDASQWMLHVLGEHEESSSVLKQQRVEAGRRKIITASSGLGRTDE